VSLLFLFVLPCSCRRVVVVVVVVVVGVVVVVVGGGGDGGGGGGGVVVVVVLFVCLIVFVGFLSLPCSFQFPFLPFLDSLRIPRGFEDVWQSRVSRAAHVGAIDTRQHRCHEGAPSPPKLGSRYEKEID
jgi:hypothetical protein